VTDFPDEFLWRMAIVSLVPALLMLAGHYFPIPSLTGRPMPLLVRYAVGVSGIIAGFALVAPLWATLLLLMAAAGAGAATALAYLVDHHIALYRRVLEQDFANETVHKLRTQADSE